MLLMCLSYFKLYPPGRILTQRTSSFVFCVRIWKSPPTIWSIRKKPSSITFGLCIPPFWVSTHVCTKIDGLRNDWLKLVTHVYGSIRFYLFSVLCRSPPTNESKTYSCHRITPCYTVSIRYQIETETSQQLPKLNRKLTETATYAWNEPQDAFKILNKI